MPPILLTACQYVVTEASFVSHDKPLELETQGYPTNTAAAIVCCCFFRSFFRVPRPRCCYCSTDEKGFLLSRVG